MKPITKITLLFICLLALPALACQGVGGAEPTTAATAIIAQATSTTEPSATPVPPTETAIPPSPTTAPTNPPAASKTPPPLPTRLPIPTPDTNEGPTFALANTPYLHPGNYLSILYPAGWQIDSTTASVSFTEPNGSGFVYIQMTNTGYELDNDSFTNFITYRETNYFSDFNNYQPQNMDVSEGFGSTDKTLDYQGIPQTIITIYDQQGPIIYSYDMWANTADFDNYLNGYVEMLSSALPDSAATQELDRYHWIYTFAGPADLFTIEVPIAWNYEYSDAEHTIVDTFTSPDSRAIIQNVAYDDGQVVSRSTAGQFALSLLRQFYASDLRVISDQVQPDGSERLIWNSPGGGFTGTSFFESRGTTFLLFTTVYNDDYEAIYLDVLNYTISTYVIP